jgi:hypothetical protein
MTSIHVTCWLGCVLALASCADSSWLEPVDEDSRFIPLRIMDAHDQARPTDPIVEIMDATVSGDTLFLTLEYAGGCGGAHEFGLAASNTLEESEPPAVKVVLHHDARGDNCRAGLGAEVMADLRPLRTVAGDHHALRIRLFEPEGVAPVLPWLLYSF